MCRKGLSINFIKDKIIKSEYVICIGSGRRLDTLDIMLHGTSLLDKVAVIADNNPSIIGTERNFNDKKYTVQSVQSINLEDARLKIVLITPKHPEEIVQQIERMPKKTNLYVITLNSLIDSYDEYLIENAKSIPSQIKILSNPVIPKCIHYCWFGHKELPEKNKKWMESWKKYCPDYKIKLWNEDNFDVFQNLYLKKLYENKMFAFIADYVRHHVLYQYGGIYLDTDVELIRPIDDLRYQNGFISFEGNGMVASGAGIGTIACNPILGDICKIDDELKFPENIELLKMQTCPRIETKAFLKHGLLRNGKYQVLNDGFFTVYPEKLLFGINGITKHELIDINTRAIHHYDASWVREN